MGLADFTTLTFDCYGTLIDWESGMLVPLQAWAANHRVAATDDGLLEAFGRHENKVEADNPGMLYPDVLRAALRAVAGDFDVPATGDEADALAASIRDWPPFPDSPSALRYLKRHYRLVILSNVDRDSFAHSNAKLGVEFDAIVTAQDVGSYKPDARNFRFLLDRLGQMGVERSQVLHTAQSLFHDIAPANELGLATAWINRRHGKPGMGATPPSDAKPDFVFRSLGELAGRHEMETSMEA